MKAELFVKAFLVASCIVGNAVGQDETTVSDAPSTGAPTTQQDDSGATVTDSPVSTRTTTTTSRSNIQVECTFEDGLCSWTKGAGADIEWNRKSGRSTAGSDYGALKDHTKNTATGYYLVANGLPKKGLARLDWNVAASSGYKCFNFFYLTFGKHIGRLSVKALSNGDEMLLFEATGNKAQKWQEGKASLNGLTGGYTLRIEAEVTGQADGDIAIDDTKFTSADCYPTISQPSTVKSIKVTTTTKKPSCYRTPANPFFCDFEDGQFCGSTLHFSIDGQTLSWDTLQPADVSTLKGPSGDHSVNGKNCPVGHFAGVSGGSSGQSGAMTTKQYTNNEVNCMTFWYYMGQNTADSAELGVYLVVAGKNDQKLTSFKGTSGNRGQWINPQVTIPGNSGAFSLRFKATSSGAKSLILLDDVSLSKTDKCQQLQRGLPTDGSDRRRRDTGDDEDQPQGANGATSNKKPISCRFGQGKLCDGWHQATDAWKVVQTSVSQDIAGHDDRFAHVSSGRLAVQNNNDIRRGLPSAQLTSNITGSLWTPTTDGKQSCLHFYYKIGGWFRDLPMDMLNVFVRTGTDDKAPRRQIGAFTGSMTPPDSVDQWEEKTFTLFETSSFQIVFEAMTGDSWLGSIAIDDVQVKPTSCSVASFNN